MRRLPLLLLALFALPAFAAGEGREMARLLSPAAGEELAAGSFATIEWEGLDLPERAEEWEAFLSLDGGRTWPLRVTPHLDISIRRFSFRVPDLPSRDVRVLLRFGDEHHEEVEMEAPQRVSIAPAAVPAALPRVRVLTRGEKAREGEEGVVVWVQGSRSGGGLREVVALDPAASFEGVRPSGRLVLPPGAPVSPREALAPPALSPEPAPRPAGRISEGQEPRPAAIPVRLLIRRFNE